jgi:hypothetical protein
MKHGGPTWPTREQGPPCKGVLSPIVLAIAIPIAFLAPLVSLALYATVVAMWIVPDLRIERTLAQ